ncbi:hypothetical protein [Cellulomonas composti]|uniref:Uncharacterized protein n=1 Tax=Cellulomonas composti TaxID=266130 RepID=A0A511JBN5_9CELL|nr:hypothetical protein [Cellulomonas composti]GEL95388.1 hypothetical protein CCO02nite_20460 [Cellulomonas composti]
MDLADTLAPQSDQLDAVDLLGGPQTFTVERVTVAAGEQPVNVHLVEFPRPWRPGKNMRRVLVGVWGLDHTQWPGRRITLYCDSTVQYGGAAVGGVRIAAMSGIDKPKGVPTIPTRGKSHVYVVKPLAEPTRPSAPDLAQITDLDVLRGMYRTADERTRVQIKARVAELTAQKPAGAAAPTPVEAASPTAEDAGLVEDVADDLSPTATMPPPQVDDADYDWPPAEAQDGAS